jgi:nitrate reductase NapE
MKQDEKEPTRKQELRAFLVLTVITAPILAVMSVAGYGFIVWIMQMLTGRLPHG